MFRLPQHTSQKNTHAWSVSIPQVLLLILCMGILFSSIAFASPIDWGGQNAKSALIQDTYVDSSAPGTDFHTSLAFTTHFRSSDGRSYNAFVAYNVTNVTSIIGAQSVILNASITFTWFAPSGTTSDSVTFWYGNGTYHDNNVYDQPFDGSLNFNNQPLMKNLAGNFSHADINSKDQSNTSVEITNYLKTLLSSSEPLKLFWVGINTTTPQAGSNSEANFYAKEFDSLHEEQRFALYIQYEPSIPPRIIINYPSNNSFVAQNPVPFNFTIIKGSGNFTVAEIYVNNTFNKTTTTNTTISLSDGYYQIKIKANATDNLQGEAFINILVDTINPIDDLSARIPNATQFIRNTNVTITASNANLQDHRLRVYAQNGSIVFEKFNATINTPNDAIPFEIVASEWHTGTFTIISNETDNINNYATVGYFTINSPTASSLQCNFGSGFGTCSADSSQSLEAIRATCAGTLNATYIVANMTSILRNGSTTNVSTLYTGSFTPIGLAVNSTINSTIICSNDATTDRVQTLFNVSQFQQEQNQSNQTTTTNQTTIIISGSSPADISYYNCAMVSNMTSLMFVSFIFILALAIILFAKSIRHGVSGFIGSIVLMIGSFYLWSCISLLGLCVTLLSFWLMWYFISKSYSGQLSA